MDSNIIFATVISSVQMEDKKLNKALRNYAYKLKKETKNKIISNEGGFQSDDVVLQQKPIKDFLDKVTPHLLKHVDLYAIQGQRSVEITNLWFNINKQHDLNWSHIHLGGADFSAAYYIDVPPNSGDIWFKNPDIGTHVREIFKFEKKSWNPFNSSFWHFNPKKTQLLIFPSSLEHHVKPNQSRKDRISLSFNFKVLYGN